MGQKRKKYRTQCEPADGVDRRPSRPQPRAAREQSFTIPKCSTEARTERHALSWLRDWRPDEDQFTDDLDWRQ
jgi:hypothetical protein